MPWDDTQLRFVNFGENGSVASVVEVAQNGKVSIKPLTIAKMVLFILSPILKIGGLYIGLTNRLNKIITSSTR
jgi:hypothetical protein